MMWRWRWRCFHINSFQFALASSPLATAIQDYSMRTRWPRQWLGEDAWKVVPSRLQTSTEACLSRFVHLCKSPETGLGAPPKTKATCPSSVWPVTLLLPWAETFGPLEAPWKSACFPPLGLNGQRSPVYPVRRIRRWS